MSADWIISIICQIIRQPAAQHTRLLIDSRGKRQGDIASPQVEARKRGVGAAAKQGAEWIGEQMGGTAV